MNVQEFAEAHLEPFHVRNGKIHPLFCPICNGGENGDRNTFSLYPDENGRWVYKCQRASCPAPRGTLKQLATRFQQEVSGTTTTDFCSKLARKAYATPDASQLTAPTEEIYAYFETRKISRATVDAFHIMGTPDGNIAFPFYEGGQLVFVKYRRPRKYQKGEGPKEWAEANTKPILFGLEMTSYSSELIITEGQMDCMALYEAGIRNVVSVPSGANNEQWIDNCYEQLQRYPGIILFGDSDGPGRAAVEHWAQRLDRARCKIVEDYPPNPLDESKLTKDANEILFYHGADKLREMVEGARELSMNGLIDIASIQAHDPIRSKFIPSSLHTINYEVGGYAPGDLVLWTGKTGEGKTTVVSQEILAAIEAGERVAWYNAEIMPQKAKRGILLQAAGSAYTGLTYDERRGREVPVLSREVMERIDEWLMGKLFLCTDTVADLAFDTDYLLELFGYAKRRNGCSVVVVDNLMTALMGAPDDTYLRAQEKFALSLKRLATSLDLTVHLIAHPRKTKENLTNDDVAGSSSITRLCDLNMAVKHGSIRILKDRSEGNKNRDIPFLYYPDCKLVTDYAHDVQVPCSWNREGIEPPSPLASSVYQRVIPEISSYAA